MNRRIVDPTDPVSVAGDIHARISSYDSTAPVPTADLLEDWAEMIYAANVEHVWLVEGVARVYMGGDGGDAEEQAGCGDR